MLDLTFVSPITDTGAVSFTNIGKDVLLTDIYGLPAAFAYLAYRYAQQGSLRDAWPPSNAETLVWLVAVAAASTSSAWLPLLQLRGGMVRSSGMTHRSSA